ncbi:hypothetical protein EMIT0210MI2_14329 [Priestia megaterium]
MNSPQSVTLKFSKGDRVYFQSTRYQKECTVYIHKVIITITNEGGTA